MRICLFWNETAGEGVSLDELTSALATAGHEVHRVLHRGHDLEQHLHDKIDCVAAAGGDGTIARAARALAGGQLPLAILPLGTANNIATSLGIGGEPLDVVGRWSLDRVAHIDVGIVEWSDQRRYFLESVGAGLVADCIDAGRQTISKGDPESHLEDARQLYVHTLSQHPAHHYVIRTGDQEISGDLLLFEALNTPLVGPGVRLTSEANPADALLSVVAVSPAEHDQLEAYLAHLRDNGKNDAGLKSWRVPSLTLYGAARIHIDDQLEPVDDEVKIQIAPAALPLLA